MSVSQIEFGKRRKRLMQLMGKNSIAVLPAAAVAYRNRDIEYPYRQDSDFHYLTGFPEPDAVLVLVPKRGQGEYLLFCRERDPLMETWTGRMVGLEGACEIYAADDAFPITDLDEILPGLLENKDRVYYTMGQSTQFDQRLIAWLSHVREKSRAGIHTPAELVALEHLLHDMRMYKSRAELSCMKKAAKISAQAHIQAMRYTRPGVYEFEVQAQLEHYFAHHNTAPAYGSIVGGGANACILHYTQNNQSLRDGDLLLIDAGCEYQSYAADITRTFPVNGRFSEAQKQIYNLVLAAQEAAIAEVKPGNHWNQPHEAAVKVLARGLIKLGLLKGTLAQVLKDESYRQFYMHRTGHWLGMDVHDVGDYKIEDQWRVFEPGMVLTVEPGLYIAKSRKVAKKWWDIGVRIEDDVVVTRQGCEILTKDVPKSVMEIEAVMQA